MVIGDIRRNGNRFIFGDRDGIGGHLRWRKRVHWTRPLWLWPTESCLCLVVHRAMRPLWVIKQTGEGGGRRIRDIVTTGEGVVGHRAMHPLWVIDRREGGRGGRDIILSRTLLVRRNDVRRSYLWNLRTKIRKLFRIFQKFHKLHHFSFRFIASCHIGKRGCHQFFIDFFSRTSTNFEDISWTTSHPSCTSRSRSHEEKIQTDQCNGRSESEEFMCPVGFVHVKNREIVYRQINGSKDGLGKEDGLR